MATAAREHDADRLVDRIQRRRPMVAALPRPDLLISVLLFAGALAVSLPRIGVPDRYFFDEILHAYTAGQYLDGNAEAYRWDVPCSVGRSDRGCLAARPEAREGDRVGKYEWTHPPFGKVVTAGGILLFGDRPIGWRFGSAFAGAIGIVLTYRLGLVLTKRRTVSLLAALLLLADGLWFVQSRTGVPDVVEASCLLGALLAFACYLKAPAYQIWWPLFATGLCLGLALATKWSAAYLAVLIGFAVCWRFARLRRQDRAEADDVPRAGVRAHLRWAPLTLGLLPLAVYVAAHTSFFLAGYDAGDFAALQRERFAYHTGYDADLDYDSRWWSWPLALRPAWYGATTYADDRVANVYANGNPFLFWAFLPTVGWVCWRALRRRSADPTPAVLIALGFFGQWLPWAFVSRPTFVYHFLPVVPIGCLAIALAVADLWRYGHGWGRTLAVEYVILVFAAFAFFYPLYAFVPLGDHALELRLWLRTWR